MNFIRWVRALRIALFGIPNKPHVHTWKVLSVTAVYSAWYPEKDGHPPMRRDRTLQCKTCGDIKEVRGIEG